MKTIFDRVLLAQAALETVLGRPIHEEIGETDSALSGYAIDLIADLCHFVTEIGGDAEAVHSDALKVFATERASGQAYDRRAEADDAWRAGLLNYYAYLDGDDRFDVDSLTPEDPH